MLGLIVAISACILFFGFFYINHRGGTVSLNLLVLLVFGTSIGATCESPITSLIYFAILIFIISKNKMMPNGLVECRWLLLFLLWMIWGLFYSIAPLKGFGMVYKIILPILFYTTVYKSLNNQNDIDVFLEKIYKIMPICLILGCIGGLLNDVLLAQTYFSMTMIMIPFLLYNTKEKSKKYILMMIFCLIPPILFVKRTPLIGITLIFVSILFVRYRIKAVLPTVIVLFLFVSSVFFIPSIKEKFFYDADISIQDVKQGLELYDNINSNGRSTFWSYMLDEFYKDNKYIGVGTGAAKHWIQSPANMYRDSFMLTHNDFLLLLCESGIIGISIFVLSLFSILGKCIQYSRCDNIKVKYQSYACLGMTMATICHLYLENCMNSFGLCMLYFYFAMFNRQVVFYKKERLLAQDSIAKKIPQIEINEK